MKSPTRQPIVGVMAVAATVANDEVGMLPIAPIVPRVSIVRGFHKTFFLRRLGNRRAKNKMKIL